MKTENMPQEKAKFFAQYALQEVWCSKLFYVPIRLDFEKIRCQLQNDSVNNGEYLLLTPLKNISDEDAEILGKYRYLDPKALTFTHIGKSIISEYLKSVAGDPRIVFSLSQLEQFEIDFLRSKSYLLPYKDLSTEDLIAYGWAKEIKS